MEGRRGQQRMQNNTILTTVVCSSQVFHITTKLPITPSSQLSFTLGRCIATFCKVNANFWYRQVPQASYCFSMFQQHHNTFSSLLLETVILRIMYVRTKTSEQLTQKNHTLRNVRFDLIVRYLCG